MTLCSFRSKDNHIKSSHKMKDTISFPCSHVISRVDLHLKKYIVIFKNMRSEKFPFVCLLLLFAL